MQECLLALDHSHFRSGVYKRTSNYEMKASPNPSRNNLFPDRDPKGLYFSSSSPVQLLITRKCCGLTFDQLILPAFHSAGKHFPRYSVLLQHYGGISSNITS